MLWQEYFKKREKQYIRESDEALPLFQDEEMLANRGLYNIMADAHRNLITLRNMLDEEIEQIVSRMNSAMAGVPSQTPFYKTAHKAKGQIIKMKDRMIQEVDRLSRELDHDFAKQGITSFNNNLTSTGNYGNEDWEKAGRVQMQRLGVPHDPQSFEDR